MEGRGGSLDDGTRSMDAGSSSPRSGGEHEVRLFAPGTAVGTRFEVRSVRGVGGSAVVYSAFDRELRQTVALKVLRADRTSPASLTRMKREVAIARQAASPRLVRVFDIDTSGESVFLTMEDLPGGSLKERIADGPLPLEEALRIGGEILEGLAALHGLGIVHRDVKPGNVLLTEAGAVKLADFGLARRYELDETRATSMDAIVGTVEYLSPEQALGRELDGRSDLYSFGVTLFEMLTGGVPFRRDSAIGTALAHVKDAAPRLRSVRPEAPRWLEQFLSRLLEKDPGARYATAGEAAADLAARTAAPGPRRLSARRRRLGLLFGAAVALAAGLFLAPRLLGPPPLARLVTPSEGKGLRALDTRGRILWERQDVNGAANAVPFRAAGGVRRVAAVETERGTSRLLAEGIPFLTLDGGNGASLSRRVVASPAERFFASVGGRFGVRSVDAVDADGDGDDEILLTMNHEALYPGLALLFDPDDGTAETAYVSSGHVTFLGRADVDGDGTEELLFGSPQNRLGQYAGIAAVRARAAEPSAGAARRGRAPAFTPDRAEFDTLEGQLAWFALGPPFRGGRQEPARVDAERRTIMVSGFSPEPFTLRFDGSWEGVPSGLDAAGRVAARAGAWKLLWRAARTAEAGDPDGAARMAAEAAALVRPSAEPSLLEWALRCEGRFRIAAGRVEEGERILRGLSAGSEAAVAIDLDAARALHLAGWPERAVPWYEKVALGRPGVSESWVVQDGVVDGVLALAEMGRVDDAVTLSERAGIDEGVRQSIRRFVLWRSGRPLAPREAEPHPFGLDSYWRLEEALAAGAPAEEVLAEARSSGPVQGVAADLHRLAAAEALLRLGRAEEAAAAALDAWGRLRERRRSEVAARAHLDLAVERAARALAATGRAAEAVRLRREVKGLLAPISAPKALRAVSSVAD
jgi:hypothetical protein